MPDFTLKIQRHRALTEVAGDIVVTAPKAAQAIAQVRAMLEDPDTTLRALSKAGIHFTAREKPSLPSFTVVAHDAKGRPLKVAPESVDAAMERLAAQAAARPSDKKPAAAKR
jgi:hypothetical protein